MSIACDYASVYLNWKSKKGNANKLLVRSNSFRYYVFDFKCPYVFPPFQILIMYKLNDTKEKNIEIRICNKENKSHSKGKQCHVLKQTPDLKAASTCCFYLLYPKCMHKANQDVLFIFTHSAYIRHTFYRECGAHATNRMIFASYTTANVIFYKSNDFIMNVQCLPLFIQFIHSFILCKLYLN